MRYLLVPWLLALGAAAAAEPPRIHALVSAVGNKFHVIHEEQSTGSHITPYRRKTVDVGGNGLNRLVLKGLDQAMAKSDPTSERIFIALTPPLEGDGAMPEGEALLAWIASQLRTLPQRAQWDSIVLATPAYKGIKHERLASRMQGLGIFFQPLCQTTPESCENDTRPVSGPEAQTPQGEAIHANRFVAPYSFIEVRVLDPKSLAVLEKGESLSHQKLYDPMSTAVSIVDNIDKAVLAQRIVSIVEMSVAEAVARTELPGKVDVRPRGPVKP